MKPKILHVLDDQNLGGVLSSVSGLIHSRLQDQFDFVLATTTESYTILNHEKVALLVINDSSSWKRLMKLFQMKWCRVPILIHEHHYSEGFENLNVASKARFRLMLKLSYGLADQVVSVSHGQSAWMKSNHLVAPPKLKSAQQCIVVDQFLALEPKQVKKPLILGTYGRFCPQKGLDVLLEAMRLIPDVPVTLHLGGSGAPSEEAKLRQRAHGLENVKFWGWVKDVTTFLNACDVMVIPSRWEPWGNVCVEAKAASKPVIASDIDGLHEQVKGCGLLVPPENPEKLAEAIRAIAALPPHTLAAWGQAGKESVRNAWENYLTEWEELYWQILLRH